MPPDCVKLVAATVAPAPPLILPPVWVSVSIPETAVPAPTLMSPPVVTSSSPTVSVPLVSTLIVAGIVDKPRARTAGIERPGAAVVVEVEDARRADDDVAGIVDAATIRHVGRAVDVERVAGPTSVEPAPTLIVPPRATEIDVPPAAKPLAIDSVAPFATLIRRP